jgi:competence protein ComEC
MVRRVHLLNVSPGDCSIIEHASGRRTMIDICSGNADEIERAVMLEKAENRMGPRGNYRMCENLTNPIDYVKDRNWQALWRFIISHPDMDHMDGLKRLVDEIGISNFWDTGTERDKPSFENHYRYKEEDWDLYEDLRKGKVAGVTSLTKIAGARFALANEKDADGSPHDGLYISAPSKELLTDPDPSDDINEASYIITYWSAAGRFVFPGDAHDVSWEYAIEHHNGQIQDCAFLLAPHHGRDSGRSYDFLDVTKPKWTWIGCAPSKHIDYAQWDRRGLDKNTSNQTGNVVLEIGDSFYDIYIENEKYARDSKPARDAKNGQGYTFLKRIESA